MNSYCNKSTFVISIVCNNIQVKSIQMHIWNVMGEDSWVLEVIWQSCMVHQTKNSIHTCSKRSILVIYLPTNLICKLCMTLCWMKVHIFNLFCLTNPCSSVITFLCPRLSSALQSRPTLFPQLLVLFALHKLSLSHLNWKAIRRSEVSTLRR